MFARHLRQKLLFICSRNKVRSLTAERLFEGHSAYDARSAGTQPASRIHVTEGHLQWADLIFVMEKSHLQRLQMRFPEVIDAKKVISLHIPDEYEFMDPSLVDELCAKLAPYVDVSGL